MLHGPLTSPFQHLRLDISVVIMVGLGREPVQYISPLHICREPLVGSFCMSGETHYPSNPRLAQVDELFAGLAFPFDPVHRAVK